MSALSILFRVQIGLPKARYWKERLKHLEPKPHNNWWRDNENKIDEMIVNVHLQYLLLGNAKSVMNLPVFRCNPNAQTHSLLQR